MFLQCPSSLNSVLGQAKYITVTNAEKGHDFTLGGTVDNDLVAYACCAQLEHDLADRFEMMWMVVGAFSITALPAASLLP
jgi:hypothetical protein